MDKSDLYWQRRIYSLERRVEKLEAESLARSINPANDSGFYSIDEFAKALGCCRVTVTRKIKLGAINAIKMGKYWKIPKDELKKIFDE